MEVRKVSLDYRIYAMRNNMKELRDRIHLFPSEASEREREKD
jgi:hypothetical protein